jgi:NADH dehydrogenase FAD-containing subunit
LYPPLAHIAVREAKCLSKIILKHLIVNCIVDVTPLPKDEKFKHATKVQLMSLGNDDYVGFFNNHVISGNLAKLVKKFSMSAYIKTRRWGREIMNTSLYGDDIFSHLVSGITFARFTFVKWLKEKIV